MTLAISAAARDALDGWLSHLRALDGAAENTITAYRADLLGYLAFLAAHRGSTEGLPALITLPVSDLRS